MGVLVVACASVDPNAFDEEDLATALTAAGATVERISEYEHGLWDGDPSDYRVNDEMIGVVTYRTTARRTVDTDAIDRDDPSELRWPDGRTAQIQWMTDPSFWGRDRIMVIYTGTSQALKDLLSEILGPALVGG